MCLARPEIRPRQNEANIVKIVVSYPQFLRAFRQRRSSLAILRSSVVSSRRDRRSSSDCESTLIFSSIDWTATIAASWRKGLRLRQRAAPPAAKTQWRNAVHLRPCKLTIGARTGQGGQAMPAESGEPEENVLLRWFGMTLLTMRIASRAESGFYGQFTELRFARYQAERPL
jgi:hypothetical protein